MSTRPRSRGALWLGAMALTVSTLGCAATTHRTEPSPQPKPKAVAANASLASQRATLYDRLGGYEAISAVVDVFAQKLFDDPVVGKRFFGMSDDSREGFRQKNKNLVCFVTGGPCKVISRSAKTTHGGLGIKASEFDIVVGHLVSTLDGFAVPDAEKNELLVIIGTLRPDIVEVEGA